MKKEKQEKKDNTPTYTTIGGVVRKGVDTAGLSKKSKSK